MNSLEMPIIIGGKKIYSNSTSDKYIFKFKDLEVHLPKVNDKLMDEVKAIDTNLMLELKTNDILEFLRRVGMLWQKPDYELKKMLYKYSPQINGQTFEMLKHNIGLLIAYISFKSYLQEVLGSELPCREILDDWVPILDSEVHAVPLGKLIHVISGNVPVVGAFSLIRGILTKNLNIAKIPSGDILTILLFVQSFSDVDPDHPITKSTSAIYWERGEDNTINEFLNFTDGLCIWGGEQSVDFYKRKNMKCELIEYGPKIGMQIIDWSAEKDVNLPMQVARDMSVYEQEACLSPQFLCLKGDVESFVDLLKEGLKHYAKVWPKPQKEIDHYAHMNFLLQANIFVGNEVYKDENLEWSIVVMKKKDRINLEHPLGRTIFIYPIENVRDSLDYIVPNVQTVGIAPKKLAYELRDEISKTGVLRISNIGRVDYPRLGTAHNGVYLNRLVKIVSMEREKEYVSRVFDVPNRYFDEFSTIF